MSEEYVRSLSSTGVMVRINIKPYTVWNLLDNFIVELGRIGKKVCDNPISDDPLYKALTNLVCKEDIKEIPREIVIDKPFYPYILLTYYILFYKRDLDLAKALYKRLSEAHKYSHSMFDEDEEVSLKIIEEVIRSFDILRELSKNNGIVKKHLKHYLKFFVLELSKVECEGDRKWGCLFRDLVISKLEPDLEHSHEKLRSIRDYYYSTKFMPVDEELVEGYNLFVVEEFSPIHMFILDIVEKEINNLNNVYEKIHRLKAESENIREKLEKIRDIQKKFYIYIEKVKFIYKIIEFWPLILSVILVGLNISISNIELSINSLVKFILAAMPLSIYLLKIPERSYKNKLRRIGEMINYWKSFRIEELSKIIWPS
ncbi:MAG: hypothetical protein QXP97_07620 [Desulfurococcus sp.]|uniref:hypothetical protein n=1 Tax=Desulfurococcus sp. TaxID=51678 RepID=UPI003167E992